MQRFSLRNDLGGGRKESTAWRYSILLSSIATIASGVAASAADLPPIKASADNAVPACATPGRLQAYLRHQNPKLDQRFDTIAIEYMKLGEALGVRWDYAFFQMMRETGALSYDHGARFKANPSQNNFAGLRPVGSDTSLESFPDVGTGVRAHLEHLLFYAGENVASPVSKRTRKQQETGVLDSWHKDLGHPVTYEDLAAKWTDGSHTYANLLEKIADAFADDECGKQDPHPELTATARPPTPTSRIADAESVPEKVTGTELARRAVTEDVGERSGLGAGTAIAPTVHILNPSVEDAAQVGGAPSKKPAATTVAALGGTAKALTAKPGAAEHEPPAESIAPAATTTSPSAAGAQKCRVWTASYGGRHAVIVKAMVDEVANFTVLDVNEGQESREAEAFISAYAKGGSVAGEFATQDKALEKAFEMCPEG